MLFHFSQPCYNGVAKNDNTSKTPKPETSGPRFGFYSGLIAFLFYLRCLRFSQSANQAVIKPTASGTKNDVHILNTSNLKPDW